MHGRKFRECVVGNKALAQALAHEGLALVDAIVQLRVAEGVVD